MTRFAIACVLAITHPLPTQRRKTQGVAFALAARAGGVVHTLQLPEAGARDQKRAESMRNPAGCASSPPADGCLFIGTAVGSN